MLFLAYADATFFETLRIQVLWETWDSFPLHWGKALSQLSHAQTLYDFQTASPYHSTWKGWEGSRLEKGIERGCIPRRAQYLRHGDVPAP